MNKQQKDKGKQQPVLDRSKASDLNMAVLRRIDPQIEEILTTAGHVCLYRMSVDDQQWQRKNIEGSLFLIKRRTQPRFQMLVLNKLSTDNYTEPIHGGLELESNPPYLMYTHGNDEIHGIWFFEEADLHQVSALLNKILAQLPKPDAGVTYIQHAEPAPVEAPPPAPAPARSDQASSSGGDAFWDRAVHVTESTLQQNQQLVPNNNLLDAGTAPSGGAGGLQGLLKAAQQKHTTAQRAPSAVSPIPVPSAHVEPAPAAGAAGLLTPAFFEQQQHQQQQRAPKPQPPAAAGGSTPPAIQDAGPVVSPAGIPNGPGQGGNPLQQLLSRAAKSTPAAPASSTGGQPQPPIGALSPDQVRDKVKAALIRLANNEAFVNSLAQELRTVGLLQ